ncbi:zinc ABC transporter substrate-binding protein [Blautia sp. OM06-15AC]|uniref:metal ABC transporter substrate-binding protein n=1 Tax=Blautia sp. OM06-15AC TaxID=2292984 RepID=UPI000E4F54F6|nr:metal ABC transporter substrate-binding protein [Blautia sp. OM06-15AC]RHV11839.1 zinc ABC transporter substrate-binding protein [Blautia sp. OM06-15AC]
MTFFSRKHLRLLLLPALLLLTGCAGSAKETADSTENEKLSAVATIFPQYDFLRAIGGDHLDLHMLLSPGAESHSFEPTPGDMITVSECDLFVYVGGDSDAWVETILDSVDTSNKEVVTLMDCVDTVAEETVEGMETHGHAHDHEDEDAHDHEDEDADHEDVHDHEDEDTHDESSHDHAHESHGEQDEHVWTSPKNAMRIVQKLCDSLCRLDPEHADEYQANTASYLASLASLDEEFSDVTAIASRHTIVFGDRFPFRYFADTYGLDYYAAFPGCSSESEASAKTLSFLIDKIKEEQIPVVFHTELSNEQMTDSICEATGAKKLLLHSCHNVSKDDFESGATYLSLMEQNVSALKEALN